MPPTTPTGWRIEYTSIPVDACSLYSPFSSCGIPQANSTTSRPRATSPIASDNTFPCSAVRIRAMSSRCWSNSDRIRNMMSARFERDVARHAGNAALAVATASPTSSTDAKSTAPVCRPVAGL
jgi:hypothetical protein